jgi:hypothetical protein
MASLTRSVARIRRASADGRDASFSLRIAANDTLSRSRPMVSISKSSTSS